MCSTYSSKPGGSNQPAGVDSAHPIATGGSSTRQHSTAGAVGQPAAGSTAAVAPQEDPRTAAGAQQQQQVLVNSLDAPPSPDLAVLCGDMGLQQQLCVPQGDGVSSTDPPGASNSNSFGPIAETATAPASYFPFLAGLGDANGHADKAAAAAGSSSSASPSLSTAVLAANGPVGGVSCSSNLSRTSSSSSAAFQVTPKGSGTEQQLQAAAAVARLLSELGVSMESLQRLLTADCADEFDQPVWMVVNLQGKIKGSYTPEKMLEFFRRGTLSASQLLLGIDQNLPYSARQDLSFYRRLESLVKSVHCGARYTPLTEAAATALKQQGLTGSHWQLLAAQHTTPQRGNSGNRPTTPWASQHGLGHSRSRLGQSSCDSNGVETGGSQPGIPAAAAAQLRSALERLCRCSVTEAMAIDRPPARVSAAVAASTAAQADLQAAAVAVSAEAGAEAAPSLAAEEQRDAAVSAPADSTAGPSAEGPAASQEANNDTENAVDPRDPVWLYINHLGWCRGPFLGARIVQAHMCGRLPRDTLVAAHAPEVPSAVVSTDIAYFFRPLGVLLDNVGNGWTYNAITWSDVATRDLAASAKMAPLPAAERPWQPLTWEGPAPTPSLVNPSQLQPPQVIPTAATQPLQLGLGRGRARSATGSPNSTMGAHFAGRRAPLDIVRPLSLSSCRMQQGSVFRVEYPTAGFSPDGSPTLLAQGASGLRFMAQRLTGRVVPVLPQSLSMSSQQQFGSPTVMQQQQQQQPLHSAVLLGHVQAQPNQAALPVYGTQQLALPSLQHQQQQHQQQQQQLAFQEQQQPILGLNVQHSSPQSALPAIFSATSAAVLPQQQMVLSPDSSSTYCSLNGLQLQQGQLLQQAHPAGLQLQQQQQQQMLLLQAEQQQQTQSVLQLQPLAQHAPLLQLQPHTMQQQQQQQQEADSLSQLLQQQMQLRQSAVHLSQQQQQQQQQLQLAVLPQSVAQQQVVVGPLDLQLIGLQQQQQQQQQHVLLTSFDPGLTGQQPQSQFMPYWQSL